MSYLPAYHRQFCSSVLLNRTARRLQWEETPKPRWEKVLRARREIRAGLYDEGGSLDEKIDRCIDMILEDLDDLHDAA